MFRRISLTLLALGLIMALSACTVSVTVDPFIGATDVTASSESDVPVVIDSGTVTSGDADYYRVNVPDAVSDPLLFIEAEATGPVTVTVYTSSKVAVLQSTNPAFFHTDITATATADVETQAVVRENICLGPCVGVENTSSTWYVRVSTSSASPVDYDLYVYDQPLGDETEPENNDCTGISTTAIVPVPVGTTYVGAIETVDDLDCFFSQGATTQVTLATNADNLGVVVEARVFDTNSGAFIDSIVVGPGADTGTLNFEARSVDVEVSSANGAAGPSKNSQYDLTF